ncbi:MAG: hypothetical protein KKA42_09795 [candidate division Zixibacteria bacterium]|nr:hypothetical protein [candidate division Zixibacteria bacterium]
MLMVILLFQQTLVVCFGHNDHLVVEEVHEHESAALAHAVAMSDAEGCGNCRDVQLVGLFLHPKQNSGIRLLRRIAPETAPAGTMASVAVPVAANSLFVLPTTPAPPAVAAACLSTIVLIC